MLLWPKINKKRERDCLIRIKVNKKNYFESFILFFPEFEFRNFFAKIADIEIYNYYPWLTMTVNNTNKIFILSQSYLQINYIKEEVRQIPVEVRSEQRQNESTREGEGEGEEKKESSVGSKRPRREVGGEEQRSESGSEEQREEKSSEEQPREAKSEKGAEKGEKKEKAKQVTF